MKQVSKDNKIIYFRGWHSNRPRFQKSSLLSPTMKLKFFTLRSSFSFSLSFYLPIQHYFPFCLLLYFSFCFICLLVSLSWNILSVSREHCVVVQHNHLSLLSFLFYHVVARATKINAIFVNADYIYLSKKTYKKKH